MATPNLNIGHIAEGQTNKETTANVAFDGLDNAMNSVLTLAITGDVALTDAQFRGNHLFMLTGSPGFSFVVTIPNGYERAFCVSNETNAGVTLEMEDAASDGRTVNSSATGIFHSDGTTVYDIGGGTGEGSGGSGGGTIAIEDDGEAAGVATRLNFVGAGVHASENSDGVVDVVIAGGKTTSTLVISNDFELTDAHLVGNVIIEVNSASPVSCFLEVGTTGTEPVTLVQTGSGVVSVVDASGVSMASRGGRTKSNGIDAVLSIIPRGSDAFRLVGDLVE